MQTHPNSYVKKNPIESNKLKMEEARHYCITMNCTNLQQLLQFNMNLANSKFFFVFSGF